MASLPLYKRFGQMLETFVLQELRRHASWHEAPVAFHHFRDRDGVEVGIVLYDGPAVLSFGKGLQAVPLTRLWDGPPAGRASKR